MSRVQRLFSVSFIPPSSLHHRCAQGFTDLPPLRPEIRIREPCGANFPLFDPRRELKPRVFQRVSSNGKNFPFHRSHRPFSILSIRSSEVAVYAKTRVKKR